ncbi:MAG: HNH endonuclease [Akkermansiaceae bacterium]|nr:HNH endonuclease [Armatimonadota bacterium]
MIRSEKTEYLRTLYNFSCGYCGVTEADTGGYLTRDHFKPLTKGGRNSIDNMVYSCAHCNQSKGDYFSDDHQERLLHPLHDNLAEHLHRDEDGFYHPSSTLGAVYVRVMNLSRTPYKCST